MCLAVHPGSRRGLLYTWHVPKVTNEGYHVVKQCSYGFRRARQEGLPRLYVRGRLFSARSLPTQISTVHHGQATLQAELTVLQHLPEQFLDCPVAAAPPSPSRKIPSSSPPFTHLMPRSSARHNPKHNISHHRPHHFTVRASDRNPQPA